MASQGVSESGQVGDAEVVHRDDVGMAEACRCFELATEEVEALGRVELEPGHQLDCELSLDGPGSTVDGPPHLSGTPAADLLGQYERSDLEAIWRLISMLPREVIL